MFVCPPRLNFVGDSINGFTSVPEKICHDHLDDLLRVIAALMDTGSGVPSLWKADIDSAFRRIPLDPSHRWAAAVAFKHAGQAWVSHHYSAPFGATSSVHAWERVGHLLCRIARRLLALPVLEYVDDYFAPERLIVRHVAWHCACVFVLLCFRPESVEHAMQCFARLVRALLGDSAVADRKLDSGKSLEILGVVLSCSPAGYIAQPSMKNRTKCLRVIEKALRDRHLSCGAAQKLAGRLNWAGQYLFHRMGRAMLRPIYNLKSDRLVGLYICVHVMYVDVDLLAGVVDGTLHFMKHCYGGAWC